MPGREAERTCGLLDLAHRQRDAVALVVYAYHLDRDVLLQLYHCVRVRDKLVGQLGDVYEPILMDANVDEGAKLGDVGHYSR